MRRLGSRDDALDATQETLARLLVCVHEGKISCSAELAPIAYGIAKHVVADCLRARARTAGDVEQAASNAPNVLDAIVRDEERSLIAAALQRLRPDDRALLRRCFVDGEAIGSIAKALGEPAERVRKRKSRALQRLGVLVHRATTSPVTKRLVARWIANDV